MIRKSISHLFSLQGYNNKRFTLTMYVILAVLIVDISINNVIGAGSIEFPTGQGIVVFTILGAIYLIGQYFVLGFLNQKSKNIAYKSSYVSLLHKVMTVVQFVFVAFLLFIVLQIFVDSYYFTSLLSWSSTISYVLAGLIAGILTRMFFLWYNISRNFVVLLYGIASATIVISVAFTIAFAEVSILSLPPERNEKSSAPSLFYPMNTTMGLVQYVWAISNAVNYFLLWVCSVALLRQYSQRVGKIKLYVILAIPLISIVYQYGSAAGLTAFLQTVPNADPNLVFLSAFGNTVPSIAFGIMFGVPFWIVARTMPINSELRDYLIISAFGLVLLQIATTADVSDGHFPPFGLASILAVGLSVYMILIGLYYSAVSISGNASLRQLIRSHAMEQTKLLDSLGMAELQQQLGNTIMTITKKNSDIMTENTGVRTELSEGDIKQYLNEVLKEVGKISSLDKSKDGSEHGPN